MNKIIHMYVESGMSDRVSARLAAALEDDLRTLHVTRQSQSVVENATSTTQPDLTQTVSKNNGQESSFTHFASYGLFAIALLVPVCYVMVHSRRQHDMDPDIGDSDDESDDA